MKPQHLARAPGQTMLKGSLNFADRAPRRMVLTAATPPQYDLRRAPVYVPPERAAVRAGADDFLQCKSHGTLC